MNYASFQNARPFHFMYPQIYNLLLLHCLQNGMVDLAVRGLTTYIAVPRRDKTVSLWSPALLDTSHRYANVIGRIL